MKYLIQKESKRPAYLQIYEQIREDIVNMMYPLGSKLPSKRIMAEEMGVSIITVEHAYNLLCDEGYVEARERSGYFVIFKKEDGFAVSIAKKNFQTPIIASTVSEIPEFPFSILTKTMRKVINDYGESFLEKSPNAGCVKLREAIMNYLAISRGINASIDQIIIGAGSEYLYGLVVELLGRDKIYAIETPSYKKIEQVYTAQGIQIVKNKLGRDGIESTELWSCEANVLHISPYRSFPSGVTASASKKYEYMLWAKDKNGYIIEDDFESEFSVSKKPEETIFAMSSDDNVIYINTFSKTISPAIRTGYIVLPKHLVEIFNEKIGFYSCTVPTYIQYVLAELISNGDFVRNINRVRRKKRREEKNNQ